jgi:hypothetical protein
MVSFFSAILFAPVAVFLIRAWQGQGMLGARDRWALVTGFGAAFAAFAVASLLIDWTVVPVIIWLVAVGMLAGGVAGATLRWPQLPWFGGTKPIRRTISVSAMLVGCGLLIAAAVIFA